MSVIPWATRPDLSVKHELFYRAARFARWSALLLPLFLCGCCQNCTTEFSSGVGNVEIQIRPAAHTLPSWFEYFKLLADVSPLVLPGMCRKVGRWIECHRKGRSLRRLPLRPSQLNEKPARGSRSFGRGSKRLFGRIPMHPLGRRCMLLLGGVAVGLSADSPPAFHNKRISQPTSSGERINMPNVMPSEIVNEVRAVLAAAAPGKGTQPSFLTAYQILERLDVALRTRLIQERTHGGKGAGVGYSAPSVVADAAQMVPGVVVGFLDTAGLGISVDGQPVKPSYSVCGIYRLP
jgi:hypothetical protein